MFRKNKQFTKKSKRLKSKKNFAKTAKPKRGYATSVSRGGVRA